MELISEQKEIQNSMVGILAYLKEVCEQNNLKYFLAYGTLIGAVRHKGFIPWDDDIDIWMPRDDYNRLIEILQNSPDERYKLVTFLNHKGYYRPFIKIIDDKTYVVEHTDFDVEYGLWIDIFPLDAGANTREEAYRNLQQLMQQCGRVVSVYMPSKNCGLKRKIGRFVWRSIFNLKGKEKEFKRYIENHYKKVGKDAAYLINPFGIDKERDVFDKKWFSNSVMVEFEGQSYAAPANYHEVLTQIYGDYMQLPAEEDRVHHMIEAYWK